jgi:hypothetical protein
MYSLFTQLTRRIALVRRYIITYDLLSADQIYGSLVQALKNQGAHQVLLSTWILRTRWNMSQTMEWLLQYLDEKDRLVVVDYRSLEAHRSIIDLNDL